MIELSKVFKCEYCSKLYQIKSACETHEKHCTKNKDNHRACFGCANLERKTVWHYFDTYCGEDKKTVSLLHCKKKYKFVYPPKVEAKKNMFDLGDIFNDPMPKSCDEFEY